MHSIPSFCLSFCVASGFLLGFSHCAKKEEKPISAHPLRPAIVLPIHIQEDGLERSFAGISQYENTATLSFEVGGRIIDLPALSGQFYKKGEILAKLDTTILNLRLLEVQAEATRTREELSRVQQLFETGNASAASLDAAIAAQKSVAANLKAAEKNIADGTLRMPYNGIVGAVLKETQEVVTPGMSVIRVQGEGAMEVLVGVPAQVADGLATGMRAFGYFGLQGKEKVELQIKEISSQASQNTTYPVTLTVLTKNKALREGMDCEVVFSLKSKNGKKLRIPINALLGSPQGKSEVMIVKEIPEKNRVGIAQKRQVVLGEIVDNNQIEILNGLEKGDLLVVRGMHAITEGLKVLIKRVEEQE